MRLQGFQMACLLQIEMWRTFGSSEVRTCDFWDFWRIDGLCEASEKHRIKPVIVPLLSFLMMMLLWLGLGLWLSLALLVLLVFLFSLSLLFLKVPFVGFLYKLLRKKQALSARGTSNRFVGQSSFATTVTLG